jgi:hypothetical protein
MAALIPILQAVTAMGTVASTAMTLSQKPPTPTKPEAEASVGDQGAVHAQRMAEMRRRQQGKGGRASTIMSGSPLGQPGQANTAKKYLTGA